MHHLLSLSLSLPLLISLFLLVDFFHDVQASNCVNYESALCTNITTFYETSNLIYGSELTLKITDDVMLQEGFQNVTSLGPLLFPTCYEAMMLFVCGNYFPPCNGDVNGGIQITICQDLCLNFHAQCDSLLASFNFSTSTFPACDTFPTQNCTTLNSVVFNYSYVSCPAPLVKNPDMSVNRSNCPGACCAPCPGIDNFYPENKVANLFLFLEIFALIMAILILIIVVTYCVIPAKRHFPQNMIMQMAIATVIGYFGFIIPLFVGRQRVLCLNGVDEAMAGTNHPACVIQAFMIFYGMISACFWFLSIAANIFQIIFIDINVHWVMAWIYPALSWGLPWVFIIPAFTGHYFGVNFTPFCSIPDSPIENLLLYLPLALGIFPAFILIIAILFRVYWLTRRTKKSVQSFLKLQFRPLLFGTYAIIIFITFWIYFQTTENPTESWSKEWFLCLAEGKGQNYCASIPDKSLYPISGVVIVLFFILTVGIVIFIAFGLKPDNLEGWKVFFGHDAGFEDSKIHRSNLSKTAEMEVEVNNSKF